MEFKNKNPYIILIGGKARSGKSTLANIIGNILSGEGNKVIFSQYTKYLKQQIEEITGNDITENNKPRELLQKLSSELIKKELSKPNFFIDRQIEDIEIYSYFADYIIISDVRFPEEIEVIKEKFDNVISIGIKRDDYSSDLTEEQQNDITEISLDNYNKFDNMVKNNIDTDLNEIAMNIINDIKERRQYYEYNYCYRWTGRKWKRYSC